MNAFVNAYVNGNLGDDLFIKILCDRYPNINFYLSGKKRFRPFYKDIQNLNYIVDDNFSSKIFKVINYITKKIFKKSIINIKKKVIQSTLNNSNVIVIIGGSLFMQKDNWQQRIIFENNLYTNHTYILGCNFGPYYNDEFLTSYKKLFSSVKDVCFRDEYSYDLFKEFPNVRKAPDIILNLNPKKSTCISDDYYLISVIDILSRSELQSYATGYIHKLTELVNTLTSRNHHVMLMSFCEAEGDLSTISKIMDKVFHKNNVKIYNHKNINESIHIFSKCKAVIATRFHAVILAFLFNKPVYPIIYNEKTVHVLEDIHYDGSYSHMENFPKTSSNEILSALEKPYNITLNKKESEEHFKELDLLFNSKSET